MLVDGRILPKPVAEGATGVTGDPITIPGFVPGAFNCVAVMLLFGI
jgi:hypothetical protein